MKNLIETRAFWQSNCWSESKKRLIFQPGIESDNKKSQLDERDVSLLTNIVYGVIQRKLTLEFYLDGFIKNRRKVEPWVYEL